MLIIGLGGKKGSGKTFAGKYLETHFGYHRMSIADPLKDLVCKMLSISRNQLELDKNTLQNVIYSKSLFSEVIQSLIQKKISFDNITFSGYREILQYIGTDILRNYDPNWHVKQLKLKIDNSNFKLIVIDDLRFENEYKFLETLNTTFFYITTDEHKFKTDNHISENFEPNNVQKIINNFDNNFILNLIDQI